MKRNIQLLVYSLIVIGVLTACDLETEKAGRVEGMWHLEQVDSLQTGKVCDLSRRRLFWSFERKLMSLTDADGHNVEYLMRFEDTGDSLWVSDPYESNREKGDIAVSDAAVLHLYGINSLTDRFKIERLSGKRMLLSTSRLRLRFRKF